jgi:hypothetical protein
MKHMRSFLVAATGAALLGCAGNTNLTGTGGGTLGGGSFTLVGTPSIEMVYVGGLGSTLATPIYGDPTNIRTGEQVQFQLVGVTTTGARVVLPASWRSDDSDGTFGTLAANTGVYSASGRQTASDQLVTARYMDRDYSVPYAIRARQARINGIVLDRSTKKPMANVQMWFFDDANALVGRVKTSADGTFRASVPRTVQKFQLVSDSLPGNYMRLFRHNSDQVVTLTPPWYFPGSLDTAPVGDYDAGWSFRSSGTSQLCKPNLSLLLAGDYDNGDTYLTEPILVVPNGDSIGGVAIDPVVDAEPCAP